MRRFSGQLDSAEQKELLKFARLLADASAGIIRHYFRSDYVVDVKADESPVTAADRRAELAMRDLILREYPDVIVVREPTNAITLDTLSDQMEDNRTMIITVRAREAAEAILRPLTMKPNAEKFSRAVTGVICQRLVRKLCDSCKEAYVPTPQLLQQLGIPAGRVEALYRPPEQPESICPDCGGIGYRGRHAIFELLAPNEAVREALVKTPRVDVIRNEARKSGMKSFQAEGIHLVARGVTSLEELRRVMTEKPAGAPA